MLRLHRTLTVPFALVVVVFALAALSPLSREALRGAQIYFASEPQSSAQRAASDAGGQAASPGGPEDPFGRSVREALKRQYEQKYGETAEQIRKSLQMKGPTADFVGQDAQSSRWLIAEFKTGTNFDHAWRQILNTTKAFVRMNPSANFELRLYVDAERFKILQTGGRVYNWAMKDGVLGFYDEANEFITSIAEGAKIIVQLGP